MQKCTMHRRIRIHMLCSNLCKIHRRFVFVSTCSAPTSACIGLGRNLLGRGGRSLGDGAAENRLGGFSAGCDLWACPLGSV